ncbi:MAG TPA: DUF1553 domain-containing protein [Planctomicrobium sp.]|nr:DUF1553 domain-containing protein [Planctomicrobium sp.]
MKPSERQHLLRIVEALCEGLATSDDVARLEALVLTDQEARRLYVEAMDLHGELFWDAAGAGSTDSIPTAYAEIAQMGSRQIKSSLPQRPAEKVPSFKRNWKAIATLAVATVLLIGVIAVWSKPAVVPGEQTIAVNDPEGTDAGRPAIPSPKTMEEADSSVAATPPVRLPEITLPSVSTPSAEERGGQGKMKPVVEPTPLANVEVKPVPTTDKDLIQLINDEIRQTQMAHEVQPVARAADAEWVRRVYLDLAGRIPTLSETETFLKDSGRDKRTVLVETLLASPAFAHQQATIWTNLLVGRTRNQEIRREELLSWLARQFRENRPWRETVEELVAAVGTPDNGPANFLLAHLNNQAVPATAIASRILLCQQLQCVQCHQHPTVKGWEQSEFWELNAFFQQTRIKESMQFDPKLNKTNHVRELVNNHQFGPTYYETLKGVMQVAYPRYGGIEVMVEQKMPLRDQLADLLFTDDRPQTARAFVNRTWAQFYGYGFTTPLDDMGPQTPVSHPELLEQLTTAFVNSNYDVKRLVRWICLSETYHLTSQFPKKGNADLPEQGELPLFSRMYVKPLTAEQLYDSLVIAAGGSADSLLSRSAMTNREQWLSQFYTAVETEENSEETTFDGTLPQTLVMMNGQLVQNAIDPSKNQVLEEILKGRGGAESERIRQLSLAALSRYPSSTELTEIRDALRWSVKQRVERNVPVQIALAEGLKDVYWAYLNSSEFALNH